MRPIFRSAASWRQRLGPAMALDAIEELSDAGSEGNTPRPKDSSGAKEKDAKDGKAKTKPKPKPKEQSEKSKGEKASSSKAKSKAKATAMKAKGKGKDRKKTKATESEDAKEEEVEEIEPEQVLKKPASKNAPKKRPSTQSTQHAPPASKVRKATKYMYHAEKKWGIKLDGKELGTARPPTLYSVKGFSDHQSNVAIIAFETLRFDMFASPQN